MLFTSLIPHRDIVDDAREKATLGDTEKETRGQITTVVLHNSKQSSNNAPDKSQSRQPESRRGSFENNIARNLKQHITDEIKRQPIEVLVSSCMAD